MNSSFYREPVFQSLFEAATLGILMVDAAGRIVMANPYCLRLFGYSEAELVGQSLERLVPSRVKREHTQLRRDFFADPQVRPMGSGRRLHGLRQDGSQFAVEVSLSYTEIDDQRYAIAFIADVTEHKETQHLNTLLTRIFQESLHAIYVIDATTLRFVRANQGALHSLGYTLEELRTLHPWDIKPEEKETTFRQRIGPVMDETKPKISFESVFGRKDGSTFPVEVHLQGFHYDARHVLVQIVMDITERKRAEAALRKEKETLQTYLDVAAALFVVVEKDHTVSLVNQQGARVLGYTEEEVIGKDWFVHFVPESERASVLSVFDQLMEDQVSNIEFFENHVLTRDGSECLIEWHNTIIRDNSGAPVATLSSGIDITDKRRAEQAVTQALIEGQEAERKRVARELHDGLGQSLTAIRLHLNALESDMNQFTQKNQEAFEKLKVILQTTTQEVKSISRDLMPNVLQDYGLVKALEFLCQTLNEASPAAIGLQVYHADQELDQRYKIALYRVAQELINNALKHAGATRIDVQLLGHPTSVVLLVEDNGAGFVVPTSDTPRTSYGLRNIETRVKSLNGTLAIDSRPKQGTTVTVEIPTT